MKKRANRKNVYQENHKWAYSKIQSSATRRKGLLSACFILLGVFAVFLALSLLPQSILRRPDDQQAAKIIAPTDSFNLLLIISDTDGKPEQLMLMRLDAAKKKWIVAPLPEELKISDNGADSTLSAEIINTGAGSAAASLERQLNIKFNFICRISAENLPKVLDLFGGFSYNVPENIALTDNGRTVTIQSGRNLIDGTKALALMNDSGTDSGVTRYQMQAGMMQAFAEQKLTGYYLDHAADLFKSVFNLVTTDFTMNDLIGRLNTVKTVSAQKNPVTAFVPETSDDTQSAEPIELSRITLDYIRSNFNDK
jgi:anionic cell wall polymer biosynthesis LytR-Cps2A-Psr (LCP) family protein